jgi:hypothetical protein
VGACHSSLTLGAALMTEHLAQMMLVQILRLYHSSLGEMAGVAPQSRSTFALLSRGLG